MSAILHAYIKFESALRLHASACLIMYRAYNMPKNPKLHKISF